jgi:hypothetical protein
LQRKLQPITVEDEAASSAVPSATPEGAERVTH